MKDVQNSPPIFQGSLAAVIDEDSAIGTLVITFQAKDGDRGQPRKIFYDLVSSRFCLHYFPKTIIKSVLVLRSNGLFLA